MLLGDFLLQRTVREEGGKPSPWRNVERTGWSRLTSVMDGVRGMYPPVTWWVGNSPHDLLPRAHHPVLPWERANPNRGTCWSVPINLKVLKNKKSLGNCHSQEEPQEMGRLHVVSRVGSQDRKGCEVWTLIDTSQCRSTNGGKCILVVEVLVTGEAGLRYWELYTILAVFPWL